MAIEKSAIAPSEAAKYVIIGNSAAAVGCIEGIRTADPDGAITLIASESHHTYSRPLISYLLLGKTDEARMRYRPADFYIKNGVKAILGVAVEEILPDKKMIKYGKTTVGYGKLLVATGSSPFVPPIEGLNSVKNKFMFMTLDDARALDGRVTAGVRVLILGAGLIGLKCAEGLSGRGADITVVDMAPQILPSILDTEGAALVGAHIAAHGIKLVLAASAKSFTENSVTLTTGGEIGFDVLVVAVGVRPNTALVSAAGGKVNRGIATDEYCRTTLDGVYAAGDCTESFDVSKGENRILALLPNAYMQGECAGIHMADWDKPYDKAIPMNAIGFWGLHVLTAGVYDGESYIERGEGRYKKLFYKDNRLVGYILIGDPDCAGIYTFMIKEKTPLDSVDFDLIKVKPRLIAFSKEERVKKLKI